MTTAMRCSTVTLALLCFAAAATAQQQPAPCSAEEYRQFDFWLGGWEVADADGNAQGTNEIESILGGCVLRESWRGASGSIGHSYNIFDRQTRQWHQSWVDNSGLLLRLDGGLEDGSMVLSGTGTAPDGTTVSHRITWTPLPDGRVRQHWQSSRDGGETWRDAFVGFYAKAAP